MESWFLLHEIVFENTVCRVATILFRPEWVSCRLVISNVEVYVSRHVFLVHFGRIKQYFNRTNSIPNENFSLHRSGFVIRMTALVVTADIEACLQRLQWRPGKSSWWSLRLTHWGRDKMTAKCLTTISNSFPWMKIYKYRLRFHWSLLPRIQLTLCQQWFR